MKTLVPPELLFVGDVVRIEKNERCITEFKIKKIYACSITHMCNYRTKCCLYRINKDDNTIGGRCGYLDRSYYIITDDLKINSIVEIE